MSSSPCVSCHGTADRATPDQKPTCDETNLRSRGDVGPPCYLGEEEGAKEPREEEEATREEHHREPQPRPHEPNTVAPDGWLAQGRAGMIPQQQHEFAAIHPCSYHVVCKTHTKSDHVNRATRTFYVIWRLKGIRIKDI